MRLADRFLARHALHAGFALPIPRLDAVFAVDDVESDGQRVDDALDETSLLVVLPVRSATSISSWRARSAWASHGTSMSAMTRRTEMVFGARARSTVRNGDDAEGLRLIGEECAER